jgi:hypothetical protein
VIPVLGVVWLLVLELLSESLLGFSEFSSVTTVSEKDQVTLPKNVRLTGSGIGVLKEFTKLSVETFSKRRKREMAEDTALPTRVIFSDEMSTGQLVLSAAALGLLGFWCYYLWSSFEEEKEYSRKQWDENFILKTREIKRKQYYDRYGIWCDWVVEWKTKNGVWCVAPKPGPVEAMKFLDEVEASRDYINVYLVNVNPFKLQDANFPFASIIDVQGKTVA